MAKSSVLALDFGIEIILASVRHKVLGGKDYCFCLHVPGIKQVCIVCKEVV